MKKYDTDKCFFLVIEGQDGVGKSTITDALVSRLRSGIGKKVHVWHEREPYVDTGRYTIGLIELLERNKELTTPMTLAMAYATNRLIHCEDEISHVLEGTNAIKHNSVVVCDRYYMSSMVYQSAPSLTMNQIYQLNKWAIKPHLTIVLLADSDVVQDSLATRDGSNEDHVSYIEGLRKRYIAASNLLIDKGEKVSFVKRASTDTIGESLNKVMAVLEQQGPEWLKGMVEWEY